MYLYLYNESKFFLKEMYSLWVLDISLEEDYLLAGSWLLSWPVTCTSIFKNASGICYGLSWT